MNKSTVISLIFLISLGAFVSRVKYEVIFLRKNLNNTEKDIEKITDDIKILEAEWSHLNDPKRLKRLSSKYLPKMQPTNISQVKEFQDAINDNYYEEKPNKKHEKSKNNSKNNIKEDSFNSFLDKAALDAKTSKKGKSSV